MTSTNPDVDLKDISEHYNFFDPQVHAHHYEVLEYLRAKGPAHWVDALGGYWLIVGYDAVSDAALDAGTFSSAQGTIIPVVERQLFKPNESDLPELRPWRQMMAPYFTKKACEDAVANLDTVANTLIDGFIDNGRADVLNDYLKSVVHHAVFQDLMGINEDQTALCVRGINKALFGAEDEVRTEGWTTVGKVASDIWDEREGTPSDRGIIDTIRSGNINGEPVTKEDFIGWSIMTIAGGVETTPLTLGNLFVHLAEHPDVRRKAVDDSSYLTLVMGESMRFESPAVIIARTVTKDTEFYGCAMKAGDKVVLNWPSANRDEDFCPHANVFDPSRGATRHLAFGIGVHRCVGERFALAVMHVATHEFLARIPDFRIDTDAGGVRYRMGMSRGPEVLPIVFP